MSKLRIDKLKSPEHQPPHGFEFFALEDVKEEAMEIEDIKLEGEDEDASCKLCCESDKLLTYSVYDDVIVNFFNVLPNLSLSASLSTRVCQQCFGKAKACVDFIQKIQKSHKRLDSNVVSRESRPRATPQDTLSKLKLMGAVNIKKVGTAGNNSRASTSDPKLNLKQALAKAAQRKELAKAAQQKELAKAAKRKKALNVSDEDYQPEGSIKHKPSQNSKNLKAPNEDSEEDSQDFTETGSKTIIMPAPTKYTCFKCRNSFTNMYDLLNHTKACKVKLKCKICGRIFTAVNGLENHLINHEEKVKVVCDQCGLEFNNPFQLDAHIEAKHVRVVRPDCVFRCSKCSETFSSSLDLLTHFKIHQQEVFPEPMTCKVCGREFYDKTSFSRHLHPKKDKFCDICGKAFAAMTLLTQHMRFIHTGIKDYPCRHCDKVYAREHARRTHMRRAHPGV